MSMSMSNNVSIPRPPDIVTVLWVRNPLQPRSFRTIVDASIVGRATPCTRFLGNGDRFVDARDCLLNNGFQIISRQRFGVFGVTVFVRIF
ncbi:hypothetical protein [Neobacillus sp. PS3-40]|uniref:hypothetical protein n=1 Tax=Neobacillus sp. PS3-40 TaxID=3070679 RepID=UPI0027E0D303|nr:hypothetical protein [Neobacillus sp. PS3-40]WML44729.1 hypothetical protein RCG20_02115 [Neobacillus sp. PS3-40]